ncbi:hypothetical protein ACFTWF_24690 [Rhodococcus sp. NPDC056960]|uniref:hypothetical protein n=1 Tax=Rhodococcus sp. NPDC056960 TaxID=3345982 RepID=UPI003627E763
MADAIVDSMVAVVVVAQLVIPVAFGVAVRADAKARRFSNARASDTNGGRSVADAGGRCQRWRHFATWAWLTCGGASLVTVVVVSILICIG